jgi:hypothetical protein
MIERGSAYYYAEVVVACLWFDTSRVGAHGAVDEIVGAIL